MIDQLVECNEATPVNLQHEYLHFPSIQIVQLHHSDFEREMILRITFGHLHHKCRSESGGNPYPVSSFRRSDFRMCGQ